MADCPYCKSLAASGRPPGKETTCFWCGERLPGVVKPQRAVAPKPKPAKPAEAQSQAAAGAVAMPPPQAAPPPNMDLHVHSADLVPRGLGPEIEEVGNVAVPDASITTQLRKLDVSAAAAFFAGGLAVLLASIPELSFLTKPLSLLGLGLGVFGSLLPASRRNADVGLPIIICVLSLFVLLFVGSWPKGSPPPPPPVIAASLNKAAAANQPAKEDEWVDASTSAILRNVLRAQVVSVRVGGVELKTKTAKYTTKEKYLQIRLRVTVEGTLFKNFTYEPWNDTASAPSKNQPTLTDNLNRPYPQQTFPPDRKVVSDREAGDYITNGRALDDILVFAVPSPDLEYLRLTLPAAAFGQEGEFRFQIPRAMMEFSQ